MNIWHLTWSSVGRHPVAPDERLRRRIVSALARVAGDDVVLFCVVDDHIHVVLRCDEARKGTLSRALTLAFRALSDTPIAVPFTRPVLDRDHLDWLADRYILRQPWKHGLAGHPAVWTGSCFPDLVGARLLPGLSLKVAAALPRWRLRRAFASVFLPERPLEPASDSWLRTIGSARVAAACANAVGADPTLAGNGAADVLARRAAVALASAAGIANSEVAHVLGMSPIASARLKGRAVDDRVLAAARLWIALEAVAASAPAPPRPPPTAHEPDGPTYEA